MFIFFFYRAIKHVLDVLTPLSTENGGPLTLDHVVYVEGRGNLIIGYTPPGASGTIAFVGSHLDVVPADPETWERYPFRLTVEVNKPLPNVSAHAYFYVLYTFGTSTVQARVIREEDMQLPSTFTYTVCLCMCICVCGIAHHLLNLTLSG